MASTKTCGHCQYKVPKEAKVCGHCGAEFIYQRDKSIFGRLFAAIVNSFVGAVIGFFGGVALSGALGAPPAMSGFLAIVFALIGIIVGLIKGGTKEVSVR